MRPILICTDATMKAPPTPVKPLPPTDSQATTKLPVSSEQLLRGSTTLEIDHAGQRYLLRVTRENKLILTK
jgi:hemin uptake protein HemP